MSTRMDVSNASGGGAAWSRCGEASKKGLQIAAVVGLVAVIGVAMYMTFFRADETDIGSEKIHFVCGACGKEFDRTVSEVGVYVTTIPCPTCGKAAERAARCPKCGKWDASKLPPGAKWVCPNCKYDPDPNAPSGPGAGATAGDAQDKTPPPQPQLDPRRR